MSPLRLIVVILLAFLSTAISLDAAIPTTQGTYTSAQVREKALACYRRLMSETYRIIHPENTELDQRAIAYLDEVARYFAEYPDALPRDALERQGRALYIDGCEDLLVLSVYSDFLMQMRISPSAEGLIDRCLNGLPGTAYSPVFRIGPASTLAEYRRIYNGEAEAEKYVRIIMQSAQQTIEAGSFEPDEMRFLYKLIASATQSSSTAPYLEVFKDWLAAMPAADPWFVKMITGEYHIAAAWRARGGGWASSVTSDGWTKFHEHLAAARENLNAAWELNPTLPQSATRMIVISMGSPEGDALAEMRLWFDRAVSAQFDFEPAYKAYRYGIFPRWHGTPVMQYEFGLECAKTKRFDTDVPVQLLRALDEIRNDADDIQFWKLKGVYGNVRDVLKGYADEPTRQSFRPAYLTSLAVFAYLTEHWDDAAWALDELDNQPDETTVAGFKLPLDYLVGETRARTGPHAEAIANAQRLAKAGQWDDAIEIYRTLAAEPSTGDGQDKYFKMLLWTLETEKQARTGEWTDLAFDDELTGWQVIRGRWSRDADGTVIGISEAGGMMLKCLANFGSRFEIRGTFEIIERPGDDINAGVYLWSDRHSQMHQMTICPPRGVARYQPLHEEGEERPTFDADPVTNTFHLVMDKGQTQVQLNDKPLYPRQKLSGYPLWGYQKIGIGTEYYPSGAFIRFKNIQVRLIK